MLGLLYDNILETDKTDWLCLRDPLDYKPSHPAIKPEGEKESGFRHVRTQKP